MWINQFNPLNLDLWRKDRPKRLNGKKGGICLECFTPLRSDSEKQANNNYYFYCPDPVLLTHKLLCCMNINQPAPPVSPDQKWSFPIVAIGASAGGIEAVSELFESLGASTDMAYVYIQHTDPDFKSQLSEVIAIKTPMKVLEAKHQMPLEPNHIYVLPASRRFILVDGVLVQN